MNISDMPTFGAPMPSQPSGGLQPLSRERVAQCLARLGINFVLDEDGDPVALWDDYLMRFVCSGENLEVLQIRSIWAAQPPREARAELLEWFNTWHDQHRWPQLFLHMEGDVQLACAEVTTDLEYGATDQQLEQLMRCGLGTCGTVFTELQEAFPQSAQWRPALETDDPAAQA